jgi:hypothetical protein
MRTISRPHSFLIHFVMVNYYKILKVSPKASTAEIKSAYRRLARKLHPDVNKNSEKAAVDFATVAKAYEILSNPQERAVYDTQILKINANGSIHNTDSVFYSDNLHAQKLRQMAIERRYNEIVDQMMQAERDETLAWQKVIFPMVALFVSTCFVGIIRPTFWTDSEIIGRLVLLTLFVVSILHLIRRIRSGFERYTYDAESLHDTLFDGEETTTKPYSRLSAIAFLIVGTIISLGIGYAIGYFLETSAGASLQTFFSRPLQPEIIFYPPIVVLLVDIMHKIASKFEQQAIT